MCVECGRPFLLFSPFAGGGGWGGASNLPARECGLTALARPRPLNQPAPSPAVERTLPGLVIWFLLHSGDTKEWDSSPSDVPVLTGFKRDHAP